MGELEGNLMNVVTVESPRIRHNQTYFLVGAFWKKNAKENQWWSFDKPLLPFELTDFDPQNLLREVSGSVGGLTVVHLLIWKVVCASLKFLRKSSPIKCRHVSQLHLNV